MAVSMPKDEAGVPKEAGGNNIVRSCNFASGRFGGRERLLFIDDFGARAHGRAKQPKLPGAAEHGAAKHGVANGGGSLAFDRVSRGCLSKAWDHC